MNISSFFFLSMDAWSQFGGLTGVQSIDDWNYPHSRNIDFNHDGKLDLITWTGYACPNTGQVNPMFLYSVCPGGESSNDQQLSGRPSHNQHKALLKYIGLDQDSKWVFVEVAFNDVSVFRIKDDGSFDKIDTPTGVYIDSWLYIISHLFIL
jgi:hypothetical protein